MYELSQILLWILWRLRPAMAVEANLVDILEEAMRLFESEDGRAWMAEDPANCARVSAGLMDAHSKLDLLIYLRACEIAGVPHRARMWRPTILPHHSDRTVAACYRRFVRLAERFTEAERLAHLHAEKLLRERHEALPACFTTPANPGAVVISRIAPRLEALRRACAQDGSARRSAAKAAGGCALARGPPSKEKGGLSAALPSFTQFTASQPHLGGRGRLPRPPAAWSGRG